jgi:hypothetical protein
MLYFSSNVSLDVIYYIRFFYANNFDGINMQLISFTSTIILTRINN